MLALPFPDLRRAQARLCHLGSTLLNARSSLLRLGPGVVLLRRSPGAALSWGMGHKFASGFMPRCGYAQLFALY